VWEQAPERWRVYAEPDFALPADFASRFPGVAASWEEEPHVDWAAKYQASLAAFPVGRRFAVLPSPEIVNPWPERLALRLVPGAAFGTGEHFTTASCIRAFESLDPRPERVLDAGCGSGILAAAACLAGCGEVVAFDIDPEAVRVAAETAGANGISYRLFTGGPEAATGLFDCVFANILAETLVENMTALAARVAPGGVLIASGIAFEKGGMVREAAGRQSLLLEEMRTDATWWTIRWRRKAL